MSCLAKYNFSLESILNWRELQEEEAKKTFLVYQQAQIEQEVILNRFISASESMNHETNTYQSINTLRQQYLYKNFLDEQIVKQQETVKQYTDETDKMMTVFVGAQKERKVMDHLKEKQYEAFLFQQKLDEQKELDEMGTLRYGGNSY